MATYLRFFRVRQPFYKSKSIKKYAKILLKWLKYLALFLLFLVLFFSLPPVQTRLAKSLTQSLNEDFGTDLLVKKVDLSILGSVALKGVEIRDHHKDTLIFIDKLSTSLLNAKRVLDNKVELGDISLKGVNFHLTHYPNESDDNLTVFTESFEEESQDTVSSGFLLKSSNIFIDKMNFRQVDLRSSEIPEFTATGLGGNLENFQIQGPNVHIDIRGLYFTDDHGLKVSNLTTDFVYTKKYMEFYNTRLRTTQSDIKANIKLSYKREDLADFNNKVTITGDFQESRIGIDDLKKYYDELSGDDVLNFSGAFLGSLNNFKAKNFELNSQKGVVIKGDLEFVNAVNTENGFQFEGNIQDLTATYDDLKEVLPNVLGSTLPTEFKRLGKFHIKGYTGITENSIDADISIASEIGSCVADLGINYKNSIDNATYKGFVTFNGFDVGIFFNDPLFGKMSFKGDVRGNGFTIDNINTELVGNFDYLEFRAYRYQNIAVNGQYRNKLFDGDLKVNDENLKMTFKGLADLSSEIYRFDFSSQVEYAELNQLNFFKRDSIAVFKGLIDFDLQGNNPNNLVGIANFKNTSYQNQNDTYDFKQFLILSKTEDNIRKIRVDSEDIVSGELVGDFNFEDFVPLAQNALGSIYTNYNPYKLDPHQFIEFNFRIYNQIVEVFFPEVKVAPKTTIKGRINADKNKLRLKVASPKIVAYGNTINDFELDTDNKRRLYDTKLSASSIETPYYNVSKLLLFNKTKNDTLFFKSNFKGGLDFNENFNLDFYYTINKEKLSVFGVQKSNLSFKNRTWVVNPKDDKNNKVTFDIKKTFYEFAPFQLESNNQKIAFKGAVRDTVYKNLVADFDKVKLQHILPEIDSLRIEGTLNGSIDFIQDKGLYKPKGTVGIDDFAINGIAQGDLSMNLQGNSLENYRVSMALAKNQAKSIAATGTVDFSTERPQMDLSVFLEEYSLKAYSPLGEDVLSNVRGTASGNFTLKGFVGNPTMNGTLRLANAGVTFPYLNVDYAFDGDAVIGLQEQSFILNNIALKDTKYNTSGVLTGNISHLNFESWFLNLNLSSDNLLVLDTQDSEEALYYGTGFISGNANVYGLTNNITFDIDAKTNPNTKFVIPLKDIASVEQFKLIHFKSEKTIEEKQQEIALDAIEGVALNINLEVTKDAQAQVVIDEVNGSDLKGSGTGDLRIEINTRGKFNMFGDYTIDNGVYSLKYGGVINKPFEIMKGGTISWNGNPYEANLNVTAIYQTNANPALLLDNFNTNRKIPVNLITKITGGLFSSKQEFDIEIPNVNPTIASELDFVLNDNDINSKMRQFFSLLAFGDFISDSRNSFDSNAVLTSTSSNILGSVLSDLISSKDGKLQLGLNYTQGDNLDVENINTDNFVDVSVRTQISDRVVVNGKVGVPVGAQTQSSVVGEVKVEVLLNEEGNFRGVIFNRQNEIQYSAQEEGYTQGVGLTYQVNFNTLSELLQKVGLKKKQDKKKKQKKKPVLSRHKKLINYKGN